jgi:ABC-type Mn2+/Zn2+ transport system permease subunit
MTPSDLGALALALGTGVAAGLVGCFAVMRRMTLAADALSHVALPGIGLALLLRIHPLLGGVAALLLGVLLIWGIERKTHLATETVIGVVFSTALAIGSLLTTGEELIEALFGGAGTLSTAEIAVGLLVVAGIVGFIVSQRQRLVLTIVSPEIARTSGIDVPRLNLAFLVVFALTIALGLRYLGVLLIGSLAIIPAATAKRLALNLNGMFVIAVVVAVVATTGGTTAAQLLHRQPGPLVVLVASACFVVSLFWRRGGGSAKSPTSGDSTKR